MRNIVVNLGEPDAKPVLYLPPPRQCPPISSHYISLCEIACQQAHGNEVSQYVLGVLRICTNSAALLVRYEQLGEAEADCLPEPRANTPHLCGRYSRNDQQSNQERPLSAGLPRGFPAVVVTVGTCSPCVDLRSCFGVTGAS